MRILALAFLGLLVMGETLAFAQISEQTFVVTGRGPTAEAARRTALVEAVRQANGIIVSSEQNVGSTIEDTGEGKSVITNGQQPANENIQERAAFSEITSDKIGVTTRGVITRYSILSESKDDQAGRASWKRCVRFIHRRPRNNEST